MSVDWTDESDAAAALRARGIESDLADSALHAYALAAVQEIAHRGYGPGDDTELNITANGQQLLVLTPPASAIADVIEAGVALTADVDYRLRPGGQFLERLSSGYTWQWRGVVSGTITPAPADERYDRVVVDLVKLALNYDGLDSRRDGDYAEEAKGSRSGGQAGYMVEREQLIAELATGVGFA